MVVTVLPDLCAAEVFDQCVEGAQGSVFYVELLNEANELCRLECQTVGIDQTLTCDLNAIVCTP